MVLQPSRRDVIGPPPRDASNLAALVRHQGSYLRSLDPGIQGGRFATPRPVPPGLSQLVGDDGGGGGGDEIPLWEDGDRLIVSASGQQVWKLSHEPLEESLFVRWHPRGVAYAGLPWTNEHWSLDGDTVIILDPTRMLEANDAFSAQYQYLNDGELETGSYFHEVMIRNPVGFWNFDGTYTDDSGHGYTLNHNADFVASLIPTEPSGQALSLATLAGYTYSNTPVAAIDAIAGTMSVVWAGRDDQVASHGYGNIIGQVNAGDHHFRLQHDPAANPQVFLVEWHDGTALRTHTLTIGRQLIDPHLWGVTVGPTTVSLYLDGVIVDSVAKVSAPVAQAAGHYVCVGTNGLTDQRWQGVIDGVALFSSALSEEDHLILATAAGYA